jgi:transcriptional regulator with XRE-family HTH domain
VKRWWSGRAFNRGMPHTIGPLDPWTVEALKEIGYALRRLRTRQGLTQHALADRCGLSQSTISRLERGLTPGLRMAWIARLVVGLHRETDARGLGRWQVEAEPAWLALIDRFTRTGNFAQRMQDAREQARLETERQLAALRVWIDKQRRRRERDERRRLREASLEGSRR